MTQVTTQMKAGDIILSETIESEKDNPLIRDVQTKSYRQNVEWLLLGTAGKEVRGDFLLITEISVL